MNHKDYPLQTDNHEEAPNNTLQPSSVLVPLVLGGLLLIFNTGVSVVQEMTLVDGRLLYEPALVAALVEAVKLVMSASVLLRSQLADHEPRMTLEVSAVMKFAVPGILYAISNTMTNIVVEQVGSTNYQLLNNMKIPVMAIVYRVVLSRSLKMYQWLALVVLTFAMGLPTMACKHNVVQSSTVPLTAAQFTNGMITMLCVCVASSFAGVYSEKLLKSNKDDMAWQNVCLYTWTILICFGDVLTSERCVLMLLVTHLPAVMLTVVP